MNLEEIKIKIEKLKAEFEKELPNVKNSAECRNLQKLYTKKKIKIFFNKMKSITDHKNKRHVGKIVHEFVTFVNKLISSKQNFNKDENDQVEIFDETVDKNQIKFGAFHPLEKFKEMLEDIFQRVGFGIIEGPDIELEEYNFTKLNMPINHPARDMQDTFYIKKDRLLRSHTSSVQIRILENYDPPMQYISSGTVYRVDNVDSQHTPMFYQMEGIFIDKTASFANLKAIIMLVIKEIFGSEVRVRFRPSYYPYTEPSAAVDIGCIICNSKGCITCRNSGWITILGSGMIHRNVFKSIKYDFNRWKGIAFGIGINRLAMIYYNLTSLSVFYENDVSLWKNIK